ncbi:MAG: hypothetical protein UT06_C0026G0005 [Candidatus Woesebacteria bacterium GW2011_GWA1_38_8]|uniref:Uncharacterized protein n=1 Tax=Candidatus Woesebacteria bacterium GW2011_GWA1_38_8 TaxID=1618547 RepID=A0A0G0KWM0_9BACT|nr:MAG: hypothetical protein UT06_C0026G0005 [Candidatus Woesebacteria bacterium GW2011_GWA1_38_8]
MQDGGKKQSFIIVVLVIVLIFGGIGIYLLLSGRKPAQEVSKGNFQKVEGGLIYYEEAGTVSTLPLTVDEIAVNCTDQPLATATELDYTQIKKVQVYNSETIIGKIPENEPIVVFAAMVGDALTAHTVALATASCPQ